MIDAKIAKIVRRSCLVALIAFVIDVVAYLLLFGLRYYVIPHRGDPPDVFETYVDIHSTVFSVLLKLASVVGAIVGIFMALKHLVEKYW